jgi:outer membrane protein OmpA-like peptidoglycan-associated protein
MSVRSLSFLALVTVLFAAGGARAGGINHFEAAAGPHNYVVTNHPAVLPHLTPSAWLLTSYAHDPLVYRDAQGREVQKIIEHQANFELAAALGLFNRFELGVVAPALLMNGPGFDGNGITAFTPGDLRVLGKVLLTPWNEGVVASFRVQSAIVPIPQLINGGAGAIAGEKYPNVQPALSVGFNSQYVRLGLDAGFLLRAPTAISTLDVGSEFTYGGGLEVSVLPQTLFITGDVFGRWSPTFLGTTRNQVPLEAATAVKFFTGPILLMLGVGTGILADYGAPDFRVFAAVGFYPQDKDRDDDGILDADDACPDDPEDKDDYEDEDGCPEPDNDKDGILDVDDKCPLDPEDIDRWEDEDGCPEDDNDGDGIHDDKDECPNDPEVKNGFEDEDGCPDEADKKKLVVVKREKIEINDKIYFAYDSDRILPRSYELLDAIAKVITEHTEIPAIFIEGHTDSDGSDEYNRDLSDRRAKSVMRYLIETGGVADKRLSAKGFGESVPVATNATEEGKAENRRVEFKITNIDQGETTEEVEVPADKGDDAKGDEAKGDDAKGDDLPEGEG